MSDAPELDAWEHSSVQEQMVSVVEQQQQASAAEQEQLALVARLERQQLKFLHQFHRSIGPSPSQMKPPQMKPSQTAALLQYRSKQ
jgi:hypothetical protein